MKVGLENTKKYIPLVIIGIVFISIFIWEPTPNKVDNVNETPSSFTQMELFWEGRISEVGKVAAYEEFAESIADLTTGKHIQAHVFGGALYDKEGFEGFTACDSRFLYGCMHEFIGRSILETGIQAASKLNDLCVSELGERAHFCQHGIGHGLVSYFGYTENNLKEALEVCSKISGTERIGACFGGIFMEYNLQNMLGDEGQVRVSESYLEPCNNLSKKFLASCIYWQSQWWRNGPLSSFGSDEEVFKEMGKYCYEITDERRLIDICFQGVGNIIAPGVDFDTALSVRMCEAATVSGHDSALCRAAAAKRTVDGVDAKTALEICTGLPESYYKDCFSQLEERENNKESHE